MHSRFVPESKNKHKAKMEPCDARKGAASRGVLEVFDTTRLVACCLQRASGLAGGSGEKQNPPQRVLSHWHGKHCELGAGMLHWDHADCRI